VDVLVNNAGVGLSGSLRDTSLDDWDWVLGINLMGAIHGCTFFGERMADAGRGHIVNVASAAAYLPSKSFPAYATSKAAVLALSQNLRVELAPRGVGVSAICPGIINTNITRTSRMLGALDSDEVRRQVIAKYERRNYAPAKVATAIIHAVEKNHAVVPVSPEAHAGWILSRLSPALTRRLGTMQ
jgi:NAD(P)-dependent dehydrogenase (short-subunit alcohol dehydrogenase family)